MLAYEVEAPRQKPITVEQLKTELERTWVGRFELTFPKSGNSYVVDIKAVVGLHGSIVSGRGRSLNFPTDGSEDDRKFELTGKRTGNLVELDIWFQGKRVQSPFVCEGKLNDSEDRIEGTWHFKCFTPDVCDCGGAAGTFRMKRCK
jgi:hypothetical protein